MGLSVGLVDVDMVRYYGFTSEAYYEYEFVKNLYVGISLGYIKQNSFPDFFGHSYDVINAVPPNVNDYLLSISRSEGMLLGWDTPWDYPNKGCLLKKLDRRNIKNYKWRGMNYTVIIQWDNQPYYYAYADLIIFEYDPWPTGTKTHTFNHGSNSFAGPYRSSHSRYYGGTIEKRDWPNLYRTATNSIEWEASWEN
ncbi:MAG: hypothetical protein GY816_10895 [Cytophagales bacterium]|nr:hypothetical protein [Cytophagales bacterium]